MAEIKDKIGIEVDVDPMRDMTAIIDELPVKFTRAGAKVLEYDNQLRNLKDTLVDTANKLKEFQREKDAIEEDIIRNGLAMGWDDKTINDEIKNATPEIDASISKSMNEYSKVLRDIQETEAKKRSLDPEGKSKTKVTDIFGGGTGERQVLSTIARSLSDIAGISPDLTNGIGGIIGGMAGMLPQVIAVTAAIKLATQVIKDKYEWDQMNVRLEAIGGNSADAMRLANEMGVKYDKEFNQIYQGLIWSDPRHSAENAENVIRLSKDLGDLKGLDWKYIAKSKMQGDQSGNYSALGNALGMSYLETTVMNAPMKAYGITGNYEEAFNRVFNYAGKVNKDIDGTLNKIDEIRKLEYGWNRFTNEMYSGVTTGPSAFYSNDNNRTDAIGNSLVSGDKSSVPVNVVNSVYLADDTLNTLADIREHQFVNTVNMQHTTPQMYFEINEYGSEKVDVQRDIIPELMNVLNNDNATGSSSYTGDDL